MRRVHRRLFTFTSCYIATSVGPSSHMVFTLPLKDISTAVAYASGQECAWQSQLLLSEVVAPTPVRKPSVTPVARVCPSYLRVPEAEGKAM